MEGEEIENNNSLGDGMGFKEHPWRINEPQRSSTYPSCTKLTLHPACKEILSRWCFHKACFISLRKNMFLMVFHAAPVNRSKMLNLTKSASIRLGAFGG